MKQSLTTEKAPKALGPYSQAVIVSGTLYVSGQLPIDPETSGIAGSDIKSQTRQVLINIKNIVENAQYSMNDIAKVNVYMKNIDDFDEFNKVYSEFFTPPYPARAVVEVSAILKGALIEADVIAAK